MQKLDDDPVGLILDKLADFGAARHHDAFECLVTETQDLLNAQAGFAVCLLRLDSGREANTDYQFGWRVRFAVPGRVSEAYRTGMIETALKAQADGQNPLLRQYFAQYEPAYVTMTVGDLVDFATFTQTPHYQTYYAPFDFVDRIWSSAPVREDTIVGFSFDRLKGRPRFSQQDRDTLGRLTRSLGWFFRQVIAGYGLEIDARPLSHRKQQVLEHLLTDKTEKQIAEALDLSLNTARGYIRDVYERYGVSSRAGLMSLWLGNQESTLS